MMTWTTEKPTQPGWYWTKFSGKTITRIDIVRVDEDGNVEEAGSEVPGRLSHYDGHQWAGPIPEPEEP